MSELSAWPERGEFVSDEPLSFFLCSGSLDHPPPQDNAFIRSFIHSFIERSKARDSCLASADKKAGETKPGSATRVVGEETHSRIPVRCVSRCEFITFKARCVIMSECQVHVTDRRSFDHG